MGVTLFTEATYVVAVVWVGVVVEVHEVAEVLVVGKSGSKSMILVAFSAYQAKGPAACDLGLQKSTFAFKKEGGRAALSD